MYKIDEYNFIFKEKNPIKIKFHDFPSFLGHV